MTKQMLFLQMKIYNFFSFLQGWNPPPLFWVPPLSEANLKNYPLFLSAIQIGACKLYETL